MTDRVFAISGVWAVGADELQWILYRHRTRRGKPLWEAVSFVRSSKDILARCMRETGIGAETARSLLSGLPDTFDAWKTLQQASNEQEGRS